MWHEWKRGEMHKGFCRGDGNKRSLGKPKPRFEEKTENEP